MTRTPGDPIFKPRNRGLGRLNEKDSIVYELPPNDQLLRSRRFDPNRPTGPALTLGAVEKLADASAQLSRQLDDLTASTDERLAKLTQQLDALAPLADMAKWSADMNRRYDQVAADDQNRRLGTKVTADDMRRRREADEAIFRNVSRRWLVVHEAGAAEADAPEYRTACSPAPVDGKRNAA
jgi:hypothetical protein